MANFTIVESSDGKYFTITDTRTITNSYIITIQSNQMSDTGIKTLTLSPTQRGELATGLDLTPHENFAYTETTFVDGIYEFTVVKDGAAAETSTEAFAAVITDPTIAELLNYRVYLDYKTRDGLLEKYRLLNNLSISAEIGSQNHFLENLDTLELLQ